VEDGCADAGIDGSAAQAAVTINAATLAMHFIGDILLGRWNNARRAHVLAWLAKHYSGDAGIG
jgi:hypothetical protein